MIDPDEDLRAGPAQVLPGAAGAARLHRPIARRILTSLKRPTSLAAAGSGLRLDRAGSVHLMPRPEIERENPGEGTPAGSLAGLAGSGELSLFQRLIRALQPPAPLLLAPDGPIEWPAPLFAYQVAGISTLIDRPALLLADDMGLGKTIQTAAALRVLMLRREAEAALLIVPAGLIDQWRRQLRDWAPELWVSVVRGPAADRDWQWTAPAHVYLVGYETFRSDLAAGRPDLGDRVWDVVVLDEAQRIKNRDTEISRLAKRLKRRRSWALTGTPLENDPDDLASILEFVAPAPEGGSPDRIFPGPDLRRLQAERQLRRRKADVLADLPPKIVADVTIALTGAQRESYDRAEREGLLYLRDLGSAVEIRHVLELIVRLKQICNVCPETGQSAKLDDLRDRLRTLTAEGHRALVFSQFTDDQFGTGAIARRLADLGPIEYTGALSAAAREARLEEFRSRPERRVLLLSLRAGGQGLNLADASYVFHFDRWWNPAIERQAEDRSHRIGQALPVHVYRYTCQDTIEERIERVLRAKQRLFDELVDDVSIGLPDRLTRGELLGLFDLAPGV